MAPTIDIVIVNWNSGKLLFNCIQSIGGALNNKFKLQRVVVVDNNSSDNSIEEIKNIELPLFIIENKDSFGFAKACNQGAKNSKADYILFLNPDTKLFDKSLSIPISFINKTENNKVGIVGVKLVDEQNIIQKNCARFPTVFSMLYMSVGLDKLFPKVFKPHFLIEWDHKEDRIVDQVMGSFLLIRRALFSELKGYDERFFIYYEDLDLSLRVKHRGYTSYYLSNSYIYHKGGGTSESIKAKRLAYIINSKLIYCKKHFNVVAYFLIFITTISIEPFSRIFGAIAKKSPKEIFEILLGYKLLLKKLIINRY